MDIVWLYLYNPDLGPTDETVHEQIVGVAFANGKVPPTDEQLRKVGLAQGIVEISRTFSEHRERTSYINTSNGALVVIDLEGNGKWWILAVWDPRIVYARITNDIQAVTGPTDETRNTLASNALQRAHSLFLIQHDSLDRILNDQGREALQDKLNAWWTDWIGQRQRQIEGKDGYYSLENALDGYYMSPTMLSSSSKLSLCDFLSDARKTFASLFKTIVVFDCEIVSNTSKGVLFLEPSYISGIPIHNSLVLIAYLDGVVRHLPTVLPKNSNRNGHETDSKRSFSETLLESWNIAVSTSGWMATSLDSFRAKGSGSSKNEDTDTKNDDDMLVPVRGHYLRIFHENTDDNLQVYLPDGEELRRYSVNIYKNQRYVACILLGPDADGHEILASKSFNGSISANLDDIFHNFSLEHIGKESNLAAEPRFVIFNPETREIYANIFEASLDDQTTQESKENKPNGVEDLRSLIMEFCTSDRRTREYEFTARMVHSWWVVFLRLDSPKPGIGTQFECYYAVSRKMRQGLEQLSSEVGARTMMCEAETYMRNMIEKLD